MKTIDFYSSGPEGSPSDRKNNFDFIRFIAASAVIFSHSYPLTFGSNEKEPLSILSNGVCNIGDTAVGIFFIISGFLVTQSFERSRSLKHYFLARSLRIFPALIAVVLLLTFIAGPILTHISIRQYFSSPVTWQYLERMVIFTNEDNVALPGVFENTPYARIVDGSLWTLSYELVCYLLLPAIVLLVKRNWFPALSLLTLAVLLSVPFLYLVLFMKLGSCFLFGSLYYVFRKNIPMDGRLALAAFAMVLLSLRTGLFFYVFGLAGGYLILFLAFIPHTSRLRFSKYGDFSYGIYIWAFPVQQVIAEQYASKGNFFNAAISFPVALLFGILSWHFIEKKALALKSKIVGTKYKSVPIY